jgi:multidrug efflux pump subunit AcrB
MNIAQYSIERKVISWMFTIILLIGGTLAYLDLSRLEDPKFTIKDAVVVTSYPGATPQQVEEEVTYPLEKAIKQLPYVKHIKSQSTPGLSLIQVTMQSYYRADDLAQIWDEMRRKVNDLEASLSPGVGKPKVIDDFGDVYGTLIAVYGDGYDYGELQSYVKRLRRELELQPAVGKVSVSGSQMEQIFVEISINRLSSLNIQPGTLFQLLAKQNTVSSSGAVSVSGDMLRIKPTGEFMDISELENLIIPGQASGALIRLKDVATISRGYQEVPSHILNYNQHPSVVLGISYTDGINVVEAGKSIRAKLDELTKDRPVGIEMATIYDQPTEVDNSSSGFVLNLIEAIVIVIVVLLFFMGIRSGILIGLVLLLTVLGTFIVMDVAGIELHRISLGALIIALGMLVDNAIVVVEGILIGMQRGESKVNAAKAIVKQTMWPLLGATAIAVAAFAPIGLSTDSTGEFVGSLFWVLFISLFLSWFTAISTTPFLANLFFKQNDADPDAEIRDPYAGAFFSGYRWFLEKSMHHKVITMLIMVLALGGSVVGFGKVKQAFFPPSNTPIYFVDMWFPEGTDIRVNYEEVQAIQKRVMALANNEYALITQGQGAPRFTLTYGPEKTFSNYAQLLVRSTDLDSLTENLKATVAILKEYPQIKTKLKRMELGPSPAAKIEARFIGPDPDVLRHLANQAIEIMRKDPNAQSPTHNWRERVKVLQPKFNEQQARRLGISKQDVDNNLQFAFSGTSIGIYRDGTDLLPIVSRLPKDERLNVESINTLKIWSPILKSFVPLKQVVSGYDVVWQDNVIQRRDRKRTISAMTDPYVLSDETAASLFKRLRPQIEAIEIPEGYELDWGGEYEASKEAQTAVFGSLPMGYLFMFLVTVFLFDSVRQPLVIWACVPLSLIGISSGLLITNSPFSFMALLGVLSLTGMLLKNGIVLLDQINTELKEGKHPHQAIVDSAVSRVRPVSMAAITTILGMAPLLFDVFFSSMAVVIMFGLGFATVLTLIVVPVLFAWFHGIKPDH